uniref:Uncharacterized protein n=1 Tax=Romanomermis culicivorax TaxID=13658 RepID=A0A915IML7_ROMCU
LTVPQVGRRHRRSLTDISDAAPAKQPESLVKRLARGLRAQENVADAAAGLQRSVTWSTALKQPPAAATNSDDDAGGVDVPATCVRSPESAASNIFLPLSKNLSGTNQSLNSGIIMNVFGGGENAERPASGLNEQD